MCILGSSSYNAFTGNCPPQLHGCKSIVFMTNTFLFYLKRNVFVMDKREGFRSGVLILVFIDDYS